jgi:hypothetical protein
MRNGALLVLALIGAVSDGALSDTLGTSTAAVVAACLAGVFVLSAAAEQLLAIRVAGRTAVEPKLRYPTSSQLDGRLS